MKDNTKDSTQNGCTHVLTGRLEMRLPEEVELKIWELIGDSHKTKTEVVTKCIMEKTLHYHLTEEEKLVYREFAECRGDFQAIKNALNARSQEDRKRLFRSDRFMQEWIALVNQCIDQWGRVLNKLNDRP